MSKNLSDSKSQYKDETVGNDNSQLPISSSSLSWVHPKNKYLVPGKNNTREATSGPTRET